MTEADILAATYTDLCTVYRPGSRKLPSGETVQAKGLESEIVATCVPCALSTHSGGGIKQGPATASAPKTQALFTRPEADIRPGDFLVVTRLGLTEAYTAGKPDRQTSHNQIPLTPASDVV